MYTVLRTRFTVTRDDHLRLQAVVKPPSAAQGSRFASRFFADVPASRCRWIASACLLFATHVHAGNWVVCDYDVQGVRIERDPPELTVRLLKSRPRNTVDCPPSGVAMSFVPETADYQRTLPRTQWPRPGQRALLRYRHLDGICKATGPCRIRHHSIVRQF